MTIEQLERFEKYYLPDSEISPYDFEFIMANSQELKRQHFHKEEDSDTKMVYDICDHFSMYSCCREIDNERRSYIFSARYRCMKYNQERYISNYKFVDFTGVLFAPQGDVISHTVKVGDYTFSDISPFQYNFFIILLKWSDMKMEAGEFPINNQITASPIFISEEIQNKYGLNIDLDSRVPLAVGFGEYSILDFQRIPPAKPVSGGLCFYIGDYDKPCISINEGDKEPGRRKPGPKLAVFKSPYESMPRPYERSARPYRDTGYYFGDAKTILGNENDLKLYVISGESFDERIIILHLFSLRDYYTVASWLIVTLSYCFCLFDKKYIQINKYWPSCPLLQDNSAKLSLEEIAAYEKIPSYVNILKPLYTSIREVLKAYTGVRTNDYNIQHQSLEDLFMDECVALVNALSYIKFVPIGVKLLNDFMDTEYEYDAFKSIMDRVSIKQSYSSLGIVGNSELVKSVYAIDVLAIALEKLNEPVAQAIISFYKLLGKITIDICISDACFSSTNNQDRYTEMLDRWIDSQQKYVDNSNDEDQKKIINTANELIKQNSEKQIIADNAEIPESNSADIHSELDHNTSSSEKPSCPSDARSELDSLVGLDSIKADVINLISLVKIQQLRKSKGFKSAPVSLHLVFTGNPGTGKTTVARILAKLYKEIGVLKSGQVVEVDRADLVAGYVGQTALKTQAKIKEAMGGVLFIDEAYTLAKEGNDFGQEAIDTILKEMEDNRGEFIVIVAGYDEPMKKFINSNPGLKSRFNKYFHFPDYSADELIIIFKTMLQKYDYSISESAMNIVIEKIQKMEQQKERNFANARDVRNYFEQIIARQASRVSELSNPTDTEILEITAEDV